MKNLNLRSRLCVELLERRDVPSVSAALTALPPINHAPGVVAPAGGIINEGGTYGFNCTLSDVDGGPLQVRVQFGNGSPDLAFTNLPSGTAFSVTRQYLQDSLNQPGGVYHGLVTVTDSSGLSTTSAFDVTVRNVAPVVTAPLVAINYAPTNPQVARAVTISTSFADPGPDAWTASYVVQTLNGQVVKTGTATVDALRKTANYVVTGLGAGDYYAFVTVADGAGVAAGAGTARTFLRLNAPVAQSASVYSSYSYSPYSYSSYSYSPSYVYPSYSYSPYSYSSNSVIASYASSPNGFTVYYFGTYPNFKTYGWDGVSGYYPINYSPYTSYSYALPTDIAYYFTRL